MKGMPTHDRTHLTVVKEIESERVEAAIESETGNETETEERIKKKRGLGTEIA